MRNIIYEGQFKKDMKLMHKRGKALPKLWGVIEALQNDIPLTFKHRNHKLSGDLAGFWECHIEPDWLLTYRITHDELILARTGTHSDLF